MVCDNDSCNNTKPYKSPTGKALTIGIELEGGWECTPNSEKMIYSMHEDGSVDLDEDPCGECEGCDNSNRCENNGSNCNYIGELVSPVLKLSEWEEWVRYCYPDEFNSSCGTHIHIGLNNTSAYENLCCEEFNDYFLRELKAWGKRSKITNTNFWSRINGDNTMCATIFSGREQIRVQDDNYPDCRYRMLNFQYNKHGTVEVRILPVFRNVEVEIKAINAVIRIINSWLKHSGYSDIEVEDDDLYVAPVKSRITSTLVREV